MLAYLAAILSAACVTALVAILLHPRPNPLVARLSSLAKVEEETNSDIDLPFTERILTPVLVAIKGLVVKVASPKLLETVDKQLTTAGRPGGLTAAGFLTIQWGLALGAPVAYLALVANDSLSHGFANIPPTTWLISLVLAVVGFQAPRSLISMKTKTRQKQVVRALPDALDLIVVCVEAGLGLDAALAKVGEETSGPLAEEVRRSLMESSMGKLRRTSLRDMADRLDVADLTSFIAALCQADQMGTSLAQVLRAQSAQLRTKRRQRAEQEAMRAPLKMLFPMVFFIFPTIFIILLGPAGLSMKAIFQGQ